MTYPNREAWAQAFMQARLTMTAFLDAGAPIPRNVRIGVGWTSKGMRAKAIGECYSTACSRDGSFEIILSPHLEDAHVVAAILTHELVHAAVGLECGHKGAFAKAARGVGLEGKLTATHGGEAFLAWAGPVLEALGPYPHATLYGAASSGPKKQTTRYLKVSCPCGYTVRMSRKWLDTVGAPDCPACQETMTCEGDAGEGDQEFAEAA